jgi:hypothetical protein
MEINYLTTEYAWSTTNFKGSGANMRLREDDATFRLTIPKVSSKVLNLGLRAFATRTMPVRIMAEPPAQPFQGLPRLPPDSALVRRAAVATWRRSALACVSSCARSNGAGGCDTQ